MGRQPKNLMREKERERGERRERERERERERRGERGGPWGEKWEKIHLGNDYQVCVNASDVSFSRTLDMI